MLTPLGLEKTKMQQLIKKPNPIHMAKQALQFVWLNKRQIPAILAVPVLASIVIHLLKFIPMIGEKLSFIASFSTILMISFLSVYWYRLTLRGEKITASIIPFRFGPFEMKYALVQILFGMVVSFLVMPGVNLILKSFGLEGPLQLQDVMNIKIASENIPYLIGGGIYILAIQLASFKFSFIFPNAALGNPIKLGESWNQTNGIIMRLILSTVLVLIVPMAITGGMAFGLVGLNKFIFHKSIEFSALITLLSIGQYFYTLFVISVTSLYYEFLNPTGRNF